MSVLPSATEAIRLIKQNGCACRADKAWREKGIIHGFIGKGTQSNNETLELLSSVLMTNNIVKLEEAHSAIVRNANELLDSKFTLKGDAIWADYNQIKPIVLVTKSADCLPIILMGAKRCAVVHAGWRGLAAGVVQNAVHAVVDGCDDRGLEAVIGPSVCGKCYDVDFQVSSQFFEEFSVLSDGNKYLLNLDKVARAAILSICPEAKIRSSGICTVENKNYHSHRRDKENTRVVNNLTFLCVK